MRTLAQTANTLRSAGFRVLVDQDCKDEACSVSVRVPFGVSREIVHAESKSESELIQDATRYVAESVVMKEYGDKNPITCIEDEF